MIHLPVLLFLIPFLAALLVVALAVFRQTWAWGIALASVGVLWVFSLNGAIHTFHEGALRITLAGWTAPLGIEMVLDRLSSFMAVLLSSVCFFIILACRKNVKDNLVTFYACALLLIAGLMGMIVAGDLFNLFVHVEVASLSAYALVGAGGRGAPRAAFNYLIIGSLGASLYLLGVGFVYAATGTLNMADVSRILATGEVESRLMAIAAILMVIGLGVKMALFPLHGWMPDAYAKGSPMGASLMAPLVTKVSAYALFRILFYVFGISYLADQPLIIHGLAWAGAAAVVFGGTMAFLQDDLRRMLAYSSISQMGLVAIGFGVANQLSLVGGVLHIANDALMKGSLFLASVLLLHRFGLRNISDLGRVRGESPVLAITLVIGGLSLVGIPPLSGFFGKWYVLSGAVAEGAWVLAGVIVFGGLASAAYVFRIFEKLFFSTGTESARLGAKAPSDHGLTLACIGLSLGVILLGLLSEPLIRHILIPALPEIFQKSGG